MLLHKGQLTVDCRKYDLILGDTADQKMNGSVEIKEIKIRFSLTTGTFFSVKTVQSELRKTMLYRLTSNNEHTNNTWYHKFHNMQQNNNTQH